MINLELIEKMILDVSGAGTTIMPAMASYTTTPVGGVEVLVTITRATTVGQAPPWLVQDLPLKR